MALRIVATVSSRFAPQTFLRLPLSALSDAEFAATLEYPETRRALRGFVAELAWFAEPGE